MASRTILKHRKISLSNRKSINEFFKVKNTQKNARIVTAVLMLKDREHRREKIEKSFTVCFMRAELQKNENEMFAIDYVGVRHG